MFRLRRTSVLLFLPLAVAAVGCGGKHPVATVSGKVTVAGKNPLPGGNITFHLASDTSLVAGAVIKSDGTFEVVDVPVGECKVVIDNTNLDLSKKSAGMPGMGGGPPGMPGMGGGMPGMGKGGAPGLGAPPNVKDKMGGAPKGTDVETGMNADKDAGAKKYVKIDPAVTKVESTTLRHTVVAGDNKGVTFDVK